jgi:hypothetical protein
MANMEEITFARSRPPRPRVGVAGRCLLALGLLAPAVTGCLPPLGNLEHLARAEAPFVRLPYVQAVDPAGGWVVWMALADADDWIQYRASGETEWRPALAVRDSRAIQTRQGELLTRRARLEGFTPGTLVEYEVWSGGRSAGRSAFRTAPASGSLATASGATTTASGAMASASDTVRVLAFGDSGWGSESQIRLARLMPQEPFDLIVHAGDIAYQNGSDEDFTLRHFRAYQDLMARVPFFPTPGNHDLRADGWGPYRRAFQWPNPRPDALYYSFRWADILFLALDTTSETGAGDELRAGNGDQLEWLTETLDQGRTDPGVRWLVVTMHHPLFSGATGLSGHGSDKALRRVLGPLFEQYGVDLVLAGHDHHYERMLPLFEERPVEPGCGPVYVLTGGGGASPFARKIMPTRRAAMALLRYHIVRLTVTTDKIVGRAVDERGEEIDHFVVRPYDGIGSEGSKSGAGGVGSSSHCQVGETSS